MRQITTSLILLFLSISALRSQGDILMELLRQDAAYFDTLLSQPDKYRIQVVYTQVNRDAQNFPRFQSFTYGLNENQYFYPASTVKMPTAFLALEKINRLRIQGLGRETPMYTEAARAPQTAVERDTSAANGLPSVAHYIKKIFLVSDNDAYNRLYEFLGQSPLNEALLAKGYDHVRIIHRLSAPEFRPAENTYTNPVRFADVDTPRYYQGEVKSSFTSPLSLSGELRGRGYIDGDGQLVNEPFDFRQKNFISLSTLERILRSVIFPEAAPPVKRFDLTEDDYRFLYQYLSEKPRESSHPAYDLPDNYAKFWLFGDREDGKIPDHIRIFSKEGDAYGFLTDVAYVVDFENNIEFFVAATIHVNANEIYNDGNYQYKEVGYPFFARLGQLIYNYELQRPRVYVPDLGKFKLKYD